MSIASEAHSFVVLDNEVSKKEDDLSTSFETI